LCKPFTIYGISKYSADLILKSYRKFYGFHVSSGVLFNHESPLRKEKFVTSKIVKGLKNVLNGTQEYLELGNIEARRDFGHAKDFVRAMWLIVQQDKPDDYIIATGKIHSIREFIELTLKHMNKNINWEGEDENEIGSVDDKPIIKISKEFYRPLDSKKLIADTNKIRKNINWEPEYDFNDIIKDMIKEMKP
jgi:GDPmannose 4,6-dehydratase